MPDQISNEVDGAVAVTDLPVTVEPTSDLPVEPAADVIADTVIGEQANDEFDIAEFMREDDEDGLLETASLDVDSSTTPTPKEEDILSEADTKTGNLVSLAAELKSLREELAKIPADQLSEKQNKAFGAMRTANEKILGRVEQLTANLTEVTRFGEPERIREAVELQDSLYKYDVAEGYESPKLFAESLAKKDSKHAFRTAALLLAQPGEDGKPLVDGFVRSVLQLDADRMEEFQAISQGQIPAGYEGLNLTLDEDLQKIPTVLHPAFKRLTPTQQEIVRGGYADYATEADKLEGRRVLEDSYRIVTQDVQKANQVKADQRSYETAVNTNRDNIQTEALRTVSDGIDKALEKAIFSSNQTVNAPILYGITRAIFDFENPIFKERAEKYCIDMGLEAVEVKKIGNETARLLDELDTIIESKAVVTARIEEAKRRGDTSGENDHKRYLQTANEAYARKTKALQVLGKGLAGQLAKAAGAKFRRADTLADVNPVTGVAPVLDKKKESSSNGEWKSLPASAYAAAGLKGEVIGR
jgi:hypothetical protein